MQGSLLCDNHTLRTNASGNSSNIFMHILAVHRAMKRVQQKQSSTRKCSKVVQKLAFKFLLSMFLTPAQRRTILVIGVDVVSNATKFYECNAISEIWQIFINCQMRFSNLFFYIWNIKKQRTKFQAL